MSYGLSWIAMNWSLLVVVLCDGVMIWICFGFSILRTRCRGCVRCTYRVQCLWTWVTIETMQNWLAFGLWGAFGRVGTQMVANLARRGKNLVSYVDPCWHELSTESTQRYVVRHVLERMTRCIWWTSMHVVSPHTNLEPCSRWIWYLWRHRNICVKVRGPRDVCNFSYSSLRIPYWKRFPHFHRSSAECSRKSTPNCTHPSDLGPSRIYSCGSRDTKSIENRLSDFHRGTVQTFCTSNNRDSCTWCPSVSPASRRPNEIKSVWSKFLPTEILYCDDVCRSFGILSLARLYRSINSCLKNLFIKSIRI